LSDTYDSDDLDLELENEEALEIEDDAGDGDEAEGEVDNDGSEEGEGESQTQGQKELHGQVRRPSRASQRVEQALREAKEAKEELARLRAEQNTAQQQRYQNETAAQERERLAQMDPDERVAYMLQQSENRANARIAAAEMKFADAADQTVFNGMCATNPVAARLKNDVEARLADLRRQGFNTDRATVLKYLIGERALERAPRANGKAARAAEANRTRNTARPGAARGDAQGEGRRAGADTADARRKRLENMQI
jgi:hypothetical protein